MWLSFVKYRVSEHSSLFRAFSRSPTTFRRRGNEVKTPISSLEARINVRSTKSRIKCNLLLLWINAILLGRDEVEQGFSTSIQLM